MRNGLTVLHVKRSMIERNVVFLLLFNANVGLWLWFYQFEYTPPLSNEMIGIKNYRRSLYFIDLIIPVVSPI